MFSMIPLLTDFDYVLILLICLFCFSIGFVIAKSRKNLYSDEEESETLIRNNYKVSNFGVPGEIKAIKTYDRSGVFVNSECSSSINESFRDKKDDAKDDLKKIEGVSPKLEQSFNEYGYYTFKQLILLKEEDKNTVSVISSLLPKQLKLDDICNQARIFCSREELSA